MARTLKISYPEKCIGCELCVLEIQKQLNKVGIEESLIRIFRNKSENAEREGSLEFFIDLDPQINKHDIEKIRKVCPTGVFTISEGHGKLLV